MDLHPRLMPALNESQRQIDRHQIASVSCWTCRRKRVKCDRLLPHCQKCKQTGQSCAGYKRPLKWEIGLASRGKMMHKSFEVAPPVAQNKPVIPKHGHDWQLTSPPDLVSSVLWDTRSLTSITCCSLNEPFLQGLNVTSRRYFLHCKCLTVNFISPADSVSNQLTESALETAFYSTLVVQIHFENS